MNETISQLQADLDQAEAALASIRSTISQQKAAHAEEQANLQRLDSLVLLNGDTQAMRDLVGVRATINGLETHLADLQRATTAASARRDHAEANLIEARINQGDIAGHLTPEDMAKVISKARQQIDKYAHELFAKLEEHNTACNQLTAMAKRMKTLRGEEVRWDHQAGNPVSLISINSANFANSLERYEAPRIAKAHQQHLQAIREAADVQRDTLASGVLMNERITRASNA